MCVLGAFRAVKQQQETPLYFYVGEAESVAALLDARVSAIGGQPPLERGVDKVPRTPAAVGGSQNRVCSPYLKHEEGERQREEVDNGRGGRVW